MYTIKKKELYNYVNVSFDVRKEKEKEKSIYM